MSGQTKGMASIVPLPSLNPEHVPRAREHSLPVPVVKLPTFPQHAPKSVPVHADGKAPKTHVPIGFTQPILTARPGMYRTSAGFFA
jgi:hypothetical protein